MDQLKYDSLYSGLVSINKSLGGTQSMPDSEYGAMIDLMETLSGQPVGESGDAYNAVSTVATMAENGELPIQNTPNLDSVQVDITSNGLYEYQPSAYALDGFSKFTANVNVPGGSRLGVKTVNINQNGHQEFHAIDFDLDGFSTIGIDVDVPTGGGGGSDDKSWWYESGMTFAQSSITSIPSWFEPDRVTRGYRFFEGTYGLSTVGDLVFNNMSIAQFMFNQALSLTTIGSLTINPNSGDNLDVYGMFSQCENLSSIGSLNIKPHDCRYIFQSCRKIQSIPLFDTSSTAYISGMFRDCVSLTTIPLFNFSSAEEATELFSSCRSLTTIPQLDTSSITNAGDMFYGCSSLKTIPQFNFSKLKYAYSMFSECTALESLPELDFGKVRTMDSFFGGSELSNLTTIGGFRNLKASCYTFIGNCPNLTVESLMNIINNLWDWSGSSSGVITFDDGTEYDYSLDHTLQFGETNLAKLNDEQKAVATNKGWQLI